MEDCKPKWSFKMIKVFLGGTCNDSTWRDDFIKLLNNVDYFNPVVKDWNDEAYKRELYEREHCDFCLYCITPKMKGVYSIAEVIDDSNKRPEKTIFVYLKKDENDEFDKVQSKSLDAVSKMLNNNKAKVFNTLEEVAEFLNTVSEFRK